MEPLSARARERTPDAAVQYLGEALQAIERDANCGFWPDRYVIEWLVTTHCRASAN